MHGEMLVSGCSKHPASVHKKVKPCGLGCGVLDPSKALQTPGTAARPHAKPPDLFGLESSWAWVKEVSLHRSESTNVSQHTGLLLRADLNPVQMPSLWVTSSPSPFYALSPKVSALRHLLWKDIIILSSPSLSLFPASAPHCMIISFHRSLLNLVWKLSRAMRHHYLFCKAPFGAVAE